MVAKRNSKLCNLKTYFVSYELVAKNILFAQVFFLFARESNLIVNCDKQNTVIFF